MTGQREPIAVIGIGCRFPGAYGTDGLWRLVLDGTDAIREVPADRFDIGAVYDPEPAAPGRTVSRFGGFLDGIADFDAAYFGITPREAAHLDPQQRLLLETAAEAVHDAGLTASRLAGSRTGVFAGQLTGNYWEHLSRRGLLDIYANLGTARSSQSGRLSHAFDLRGPSVSVDTACSSGLVAVHLACQSLRAGESELALAAGVNVILSPDEAITFSQANMLSPDGRCKFGAASADGFVRSEGVGVLVLKPLARALADGDAVHAVLPGSAVRNDGQSGGSMMTPAEAGQVETLLAAYADAGVSPAEVGYVEAHGTGTPVGDPVELRALARVFGGPLAVGSVKTNIGHAESAAGMAGLIKAILCVRHRHLPASLHAAELTTAFGWDGIELVRTARPWPSEGRAIAGVTSIGISGTNAHCVVVEHVPAEVSAAEEETDRILTLSAKGHQALLDLAQSYVDFLEPGGDGHQVPLADICHTAAARRDHTAHRLTAVASSHRELAEKLRAVLAGRPARGTGITDDVPSPPRVVFVFPGQGSQWTGMARDLLRDAPAFAAKLAECDAAVRAEAGWSVLEEVADDNGLSAIDRIQPTLWAVEIALAAQWTAWGVRPDAVVGHSMGESAAACVAGSLSLADGAAVICRRSALLAGVAGQGAMASVELTAEQAEVEIADCADQVSVAVSNSASSTVLAGDAVALDRVLARLAAREVFCRKVKVDVASHSPQMDALRGELLEALGSLTPRPGELRMVSTVDCADLDGTELSGEYWVRNLREPVRFGQVISALADEGPVVFVELSPHPVLLPAVEEQGCAVVGSTRRGEPERAALLESLAAVHRVGVVVQWPAVNPGRHVRLPRYPWQRGRHWFASGEEVSPHQLLSGFAGGSGRWEGRIDLVRNAFLTDHLVQDTVVLPGTAYAELVFAVAGNPVELRDVTYHRAIYLDAEPAVLLELDDGKFTVHSRLNGAEDWEISATGQVAAAPESRRRSAPAELRGQLVEQLSGEVFYQRFAEGGNQWRGAFRGIEAVWRGVDEAVASIGIPASIAGSLASHVFHPAVLDACGQVLAAAIGDEERAKHGSAFVLGGISVLRVHERPRGPVWAHAVRTEPGRDDSFAGDVTVTDEDGRVLAEFSGLRLQYLDPAAEPEVRLHELRWRQVPEPPARTGTGYWVVFGDHPVPDLERAVLVKAGKEFRSLGGGRFEIDPEEAGGYRKMIDAAGREFPDLPCQGVVRMWNTDAEADCRGVLRLVAALDERAPLWLVTRGAQQTGRDSVVNPDQSALWGLGRTLAQEHSERRCTLVDLPAFGEAALARELLAQDGEPQIALRPHGRYAARLVQGGPQPVSGPRALTVPAPGLLDELGLQPRAASEPRRGEVLIQVNHAGVNYRDVLMATGTYPGQREMVELGWECAGTVTALGEGIAGLAVGDAVVTATPAAMGTHVLADARHVFGVPARVSTEEAAALPIAYLTAYHGLQVLGGLKEGERVLIHSATGGVGLAALRYAKFKGAEVYATAGSAEKRSMLRMLGVRYAGDSRSTAFAEEVLAATKGHGVDVVLNTLAGPAIMANLEVLAPYGRYVELSKRDLIDGTSIGLSAFAKNLTYSAFDVTQLLRDRPREAAAALEHVLGLVEAGLLDPLPVETHPVAEAAGAFRRMASARHSGKLVLDFAGTTGGRRMDIRQDATYLVTGGLGGLGRAVCAWLLDSGAGNVLAVGRSPMSENLDPRITYAQLDIADEAGLRTLLRARADAGSPPLRGVVHAAGVINYTGLAELTARELKDVLRPKAAGGWAAHRATLGLPLDFFVLFSSGAAILGSPRLGAYAAANAFLDGLAQHRRLAGLPATSVNWGFWSGAGMVEEYEREHGRKLSPTGFGAFGIGAGLAMLRELLDRDAVQAAVLAADWPRWAEAYPAAARDPLLRELVGPEPPLPSPPAEVSRPAKAAVQAKPVVDVTAFLAAEIASVMGLPVDRLDLARPLNRQGFDSLMAGQVRGRVKLGLGVLLPITRMLSGQSVADLADGLREQLDPIHPDEG